MVSYQAFQADIRNGQLGEVKILHVGGYASCLAATMIASAKLLVADGRLDELTPKQAEGFMMLDRATGQPDEPHTWISPIREDYIVGIATSAVRARRWVHTYLSAREAQLGKVAVTAEALRKVYPHNTMTRVDMQITPDRIVILRRRNEPPFIE